LTPSAKLRVTFRVLVPTNLPPNTLELVLQNAFIASPLGSYTAKLFDGSALLGVHTSTLLGLTEGPMGPFMTFSEWKSPASPFRGDNPTVIDFTTILDGTIQGVVEFTIATGAMDFDLDNVWLNLGQAFDANSQVLVVPQPFITSVGLGSFESYCFS